MTEFCKVVVSVQGMRTLHHRSTVAEPHLRYHQEGVICRERTLNEQCFSAHDYVIIRLPNIHDLALHKLLTKKEFILVNL